MRSLRDIQDNLVSQDSPGVDPSTIAEQQRELQVNQLEAMWPLGVIDASQIEIEFSDCDFSFVLVSCLTN